MITFITMYMCMFQCFGMERATCLPGVRIYFRNELYLVPYLFYELQVRLYNYTLLKPLAILPPSAWVFGPLPPGGGATLTTLTHLGGGGLTPLAESSTL